MEADACDMCNRRIVTMAVRGDQLVPRSSVTVKSKFLEIVGRRRTKKGHLHGKLSFCEPCVGLLRDVTDMELKLLSLREGIRKIHAAAEAEKTNRTGDERSGIYGSHLDPEDGDELSTCLPFDDASDVAYICRICDVTFNAPEELMEHLVVHNKERSFVCRTCNLGFKHEESLVIHSEKTHGFVDVTSPPFVSDVIGNEIQAANAVDLEVFAEMTSVTRRRGRPKKAQIDHPSEEIDDSASKPFRCDSCPAAFRTKFFLEEHARTHAVPKRVERSLPCHICEKSFCTKYKLSRHMRSHREIREPLPDGSVTSETSEEVNQVYRIAEEEAVQVTASDVTPSTCDLCAGKQFGSFSLLERHRIEEHGTDGRFRCAESGCTRSFKYKKGLERHRKEHSVTSEFKCEVCHAEFKRRDCFKLHMTSHEKARNEACAAVTSEMIPPVETDSAPIPSSFACVVCRAIFSSAQSLYTHVKTHVQRYDHICDLCGRRFKSRKLLLTHRKRHLAERSHACPECGKAFVDRSGLNSHAKSHVRSRDHVCDVCGKGFIRSAHLRDHLATHSGAKKFRCAECGFGTLSLWKLRNHQRTHSGERPFLCVTCGKGFAQKTNLDAHVRIHTGFRLLKCNLCDEQFNRQKQLEAHISTAHGDPSAAQPSTSGGGHDYLSEVLEVASGMENDGVTTHVPPVYV